MIVQQRQAKAGSMTPSGGGGRSLIPVARRSIPNLSSFTVEQSPVREIPQIHQFKSDTSTIRSKVQISSSISQQQQQTVRGISRSESTLNAATVTLYNRHRNAINSEELWSPRSQPPKIHWPPPPPASEARSESSLFSDLSATNGSESPNADNFTASTDLRINIRHHSSSTLQQQHQKMINKNRPASEGIKRNRSQDTMTTSTTTSSTSSSTVKATFVLAKTSKVDQTSQTQQLRSNSNRTSAALLNGASLCSTSSSAEEQTSKRGSVSMMQAKMTKNGGVGKVGADGVLKRLPNNTAAGGTNAKAQGGHCNCELQLEQQLQEKDMQIAQLMKVLSEKDGQLDDLYFAVEDKEQHISQLIEEIRKRKADLAELSRKIIAMDQELKAVQHVGLQQPEFGRMSASSRPFSPVFSTCDSSVCHPEGQQQQQTNNNRWFTPLRTTFSKGKQSNSNKGKGTSSSLSRKQSNNEYVHELKSILREKEMMITELRLESKLTCTRLEELETTLQRREEETANMRKTNDYLEKAIKSKLLD